MASVLADARPVTDILPEMFPTVHARDELLSHRGANATTIISRSLLRTRSGARPQSGRIR